MPNVLLVVFNRYHGLPHFFEDVGLRLIVDVALQQFEDIQAIPGIADKSREHDVQAVIERDEFIPVSRAPSDGCFIRMEALLGQIVRLERPNNVTARKPRTIQCNADARGKDRINKPRRVADHDETVAADLGHGVTVVALCRERTQWYGLLQVFINLRPLPDAGPEELFPRRFSFEKILFLRHYANTGYGRSDWDLPNPTVVDRQKMDEHIILFNPSVRDRSPQTRYERRTDRRRGL